MKKTIGILALIILVAIAIFANDKKTEGVKKIGIIQYGDIQVWEDVKSGIKEGLADAGYVEGKNLTLDIQNAHNDNSTMQSIAQNFANGNYDIIISFGTGTSQAIANLERTKPIVFAAVTDPKSAKLVVDPAKPGANISGTSDVTLYKEGLELLKKINPNIKKVGVLSNPGESNSVFGLSETKRYAKELGLEIVDGSINGTADVYQTAKAISPKVDAFYELPDNSVVAGAESLIKATLEDKKPLVAFSEEEVKKGALITLGTSYKKVGVRTAEIAVRVLGGEKIGDIPVLGVTDADIFYNKKTADLLGIKLSNEIIKNTKAVY